MLRTKSIRFLMFFGLITLLVTGCTTKDLRFQNEFPMVGSVPKDLLHPTDIAIDSNGFVYVCDTGNDRIVKFNAEGEYQTTFTAGKLSRPSGICVDKSDRIYVADTGRDRILVYSSTGAGLMSISGSRLGQSQEDATKLFRPRDVAVDEEFQIYVLDYHHRLLLFDSSGNLKNQFGAEGHRLNEFKFPNRIDVTPHMDENKSQYIYVADTFNKRVMKFDKTLKLIFSATEKGLMDKLRDPRGVTVTPEGDFFVSDAGDTPVAGYKSNGVLVSRAGSFGRGRGRILSPGGIAYSKTNQKIYVTDTLQNKVLIFSAR